MTYKITFQMQRCPFIMSLKAPTMFDGLLARAYFEEHATGQEKEVRALRYDTPFDFTGLPLVKHEHGYYMASWLHFDETKAATQVHTFLKKWDESMDSMADFGKAKRQVMIDRGEFKTTQIPMFAITAPQVWFYFQSNDVQEVERLISKHIHGIGKKISRGYGYFDSFEIEECENLFETQILRPIPARQEDIKNLQGAQKFEYRSWRFPYEMPENFCFCRVA